ncbi:MULTISPECIES: polyprenyl synthetase family protein [unclassified Streptomyces]|uniref:polyprenyl synthetase family protein n=1 Tax=unclassified Streptomyces TaxID=2593676 RepID=UPI000823B91F|nr:MULTISPECIES: polyprenyl synthetase family protein [unclassified Streptomyces]AWN31568.1 polyprenyl synthetase family protein [Streptomyces sp. NEAU-S7GS2]MYT11029.1 polyprenyl synthetase family protein [Streptomyces sp. SID4951]SCK06090.1 geranylgeranyl diphosphate synthase, type I [Streptomyces sp. SceaMP-e96]
MRRRTGATAPLALRDAGPPPSGCPSGNALPGRGDTCSAGLGPDTVDADVPAAVGRMLVGVLGEQVARAAEIEGTFARDVAARVARFTLEGGKRTRSQFLWWGLRSCEDRPGACAVEPALRVSAAVELIQTCALIHDDAMDRSPLRRGRPSVHAEFAGQYATPGTAEAAGRFGTSAAVLAGDLALAWADDTVAGAELPAETAPRVRHIWRAMRMEMVAGQYLDLYGQIAGSRSASLAVRTAYLKSARYSVERPLALGAALAGADEDTTRALCAAGRCAGVAFQFQDDLMGVFGDQDRTGKPSGGDIREGKLTYLLAVGRARAMERGDRAALALLDRCVGDSELDAADLERVRAVLVATGALGLVELRIHRLVARSIRHLAAAALEPSAAARLRCLFASVAGLRTATVRGPAPDGVSSPVPAGVAEGGAG